VTLRLLPVGAHTGFLGALCVPDDLYWVSRAPVALAGMAYPGRADWALLASEGIGHVVCLTHEVAPYDPSPCTVSAFRLQDLVSGDPPSEPTRELELVVAAATDVVAHLARDVGVAVHCMGGRGRTGTVLGVALVRLGHEPDAVIDYLHRLAVGRGRRGWPESHWQADVVRSTKPEVDRKPETKPRA
jgi:Tyrosine phosphatase family